MSKHTMQQYNCMNCEWTIKTHQMYDGRRCPECNEYIIAVFNASKRRPPLGLKPRWIHDEERLEQVKAAIGRFIDASRNVPIEWIEEHNELTTRLENRQSNTGG